MSTAHDLKQTKPIFRRAHYRWLADYAKQWDTASQVDFATALYDENINFKPVRWFQACGYDRTEAEKLHDQVMRKFA